MNYKWIKCAVRTFYDCFPALHKIQDIYRALCIERRLTRKPIPACLNKFQLVQAGSLLGPTGAFTQKLDSVDQVPLHPVSLPVPVDVCDLGA